VNLNIDPLRRSLLRRFSIDTLEKLERLPRSLSPAERVAWWLLIGFFVISAFVVAQRVNALALIEVPDRGGSLTEGIVGSPRFINPLLAISDADRDLTALTYSGLLRASPNGGFVPDLALSYEISQDGLTYHFTLRENATFHDGSVVTADDILFTIERARDPALKSPRRPNWDGVTVEKVDARTVRFTLKQAYAPFLENTTIGILPKHLWSQSDAEQFAFSKYNTEPVGSGPYRVTAIVRDSSGIPEAYELAPFKSYALGTPYLNALTVKFYGNEDDLISAWERKDIESMSGISFDRLKELASRGANILTSSLPRIFGIFLNQNQAPVLAHAEVRQALNMLVDRNKIVEEVLHGYGRAIGSPIPPDTVGFAARAPQVQDSARAEMLLEKNGWKRNPGTNIWEKTVKKKTEKLAFSIATSNAPELKSAALMIAKDWRVFGIDVTVKLFETGDLNQNVIRPRNYDALLFGEIVGRELDLFAFWDSSQRNDPGLNIALYTNSTADKLLESARTTTNIEDRLLKYQQFEQQVVDDVGAIFLYAPDFIYIMPKRLEGVLLGPGATQSERFENVYEWYTETSRVWRIFTNA